jgi:NADH-quinone oxidoreductase subunit J
MVEQIKNILIGFEDITKMGDVLIFNFFIVLKYSILFAALMTVASINPIHSVLYLVLTFVLTAVLVMSLGAEFLGILLVIVYVGAIAVLFLFIVMMLNIEEQKKEISVATITYLISSLLVTILLSTLITKFIYDFVGGQQLTLLNLYILPFHMQFTEWVGNLSPWENIVVLGSALYTYYYHLLILSGFILLLAMIASISLALTPPEFAILRPKHQDKYEQLKRSLNKAVNISTWSKK